MLRLDQNIIITDQLTGKEKFIFPFLSNVEIMSSRETFTDTAIVKLPQRTRRLNQKISDLINIGDKIDIYLSYFDPLIKPILEFSGYITAINPDSPMVLNCEDEAFNYKKESLGALKQKDTTLKTLINRIYSGKTNIFDVSIGTWVIDQNATLIDVLDELRNKIGILSYWQDWQSKILNVNSEFNNIPDKTVIFDVQQNVPQGTDNLKVQKATDMQTISYGISPQKDGSKIEIYSYYADASGKTIISSIVKPKGVLNTLKIPELNLTDLTKLTEQRLPKLFYNGIDGTITTFGEPSFKHGDLAAVRDLRLKDRNGIYQIIEVKKSFGVGIGYKQTAKLGEKVNEFS